MFQKNLIYKIIIEAKGKCDRTDLADKYNSYANEKMAMCFAIMMETAWIRWFCQPIFLERITT